MSNKLISLIALASLFGCSNDVPTSRAPGNPAKTPRPETNDEVAEQVAPSEPIDVVVHIDFSQLAGVPWTSARADLLSHPANCYGSEPIATAEVAHTEATFTDLAVGDLYFASVQVFDEQGALLAIACTETFEVGGEVPQAHPAPLSLLRAPFSFHFSRAVDVSQMQLRKSPAGAQMLNLINFLFSPANTASNWVAYDSVSQSYVDAGVCAGKQGVDRSDCEDDVWMTAGYYDQFFSGGGLAGDEVRKAIAADLAAVTSFQLHLAAQVTDQPRSITFTIVGESHADTTLCSTTGTTWVTAAMDVASFATVEQDAPWVAATVASTELPFTYYGLLIDALERDILPRRLPSRFMRSGTKVLMHDFIEGLTDCGYVLSVGEARLCQQYLMPARAPIINSLQPPASLENDATLPLAFTDVRLIDNNGDLFADTFSADQLQPSSVCSE